MKKSLKLLVLPAAMVLLAGNMTSCAPSQKEIAMISDVGDIDDGSFNQGCWEAVKEYGATNNRSYDYYRPFADSEFARKCAVKQAVLKGAKIIIMPGFKFTSTSVDVANEYPNVHFVLIDSSIPTGVTIPENLIAVTYNFQYSGWLAGYSVAKDYFETDMKNDNKLKDEYGFGFMGGMSNGGVFPYGFGFIQGVLYAAQEFTTALGYTGIQPQININYSYAGVFMQDDSACATVKGWYANQGIDCVFACGGKLYQSVTEALKYYNNSVLDPKYRNFEDQKAPRDAARWIGVDGDQYSLVQDLDEKKSIFSSALKDVGHTCKVALDYHFDLDDKGNSEWATLRSAMEGKQSFNLGIKSQFKLGSDKPYDQDYSYVGIVDKPKDEKDENDVVRGYNHVTVTDLKIMKDELYEEKIQVYTGFNTTDDDKHGEFGEKAGYPENVFKSSAFKAKYNYFKSESDSSDHYPDDKFTIRVM